MPEVSETKLIESKIKITSRDIDGLNESVSDYISKGYTIKIPVKHKFIRNKYVYTTTLTKEVKEPNMGEILDNCFEY